MDVASGAGRASKSDPDSSTQIRTPKPVSFTGNGGVVYKECLKNHAASLGAHALDGCGEFMPSQATNPSDPTSLLCAACGCHRNFHRQENMTGTLPSFNYQPHRRHTPPPSPPGYGGGGGASTPSLPSPSPISYSYHPSAPHLLFTLSGGSTPVVGGGGGSNWSTATPVVVVNSSGGGRKRFRTRFTQNQKDKMLEFAEKLGWKMQRKDEDLIVNFCNEIAVEKCVFKVWMHNNKNIFGKKENNNSKSPPPPRNSPKLEHLCLNRHHPDN